MSEGIVALRHQEQQQQQQQEQLQQQQKWERLYAASVRAMAGEPGVRLRGHRLVRDGTPIDATAPHLHPTAQDDHCSWRGAADGIALRLLHSDASMYVRTRPEGEVAEFVFELLEQYRVESLVDPTMAGAARNLRHRHQTWCTAFGTSGLVETPEGLLLYAVALLCRAKVSAEPIDLEVEDVIESTRMRLAPRIGAPSAALRRTRRDQAVYAVHARHIAEVVAQMVESAAPERPSRGGPSRGGPPRRRPATLRVRGGFSLVHLSPGDPSSEDGVARSNGTADVDSLPDDPPAYRVHTRAYDRTMPVTDLIRAAKLTAYRHRLDELVGQVGSVGPLARRLFLLLAQPARDGYEGAQEEGVIDGRSLTRLITSEQERRIFQLPRTGARAGTRVTVLIDCSGSMRRHQEVTAPLVDILTRALDLAQVNNEVLAFSTGAWHGGSALRDWKRSRTGARQQPGHRAAPQPPGRVAERLHLVLKNADTSWRRARPSIAGLLDGELYREGLDGEAVAWAGDRMRTTPDLQRLVIVLCDGSPMESATSATNGEHYLGAHLRAVIDQEEASGTHIVGLGFGADLSHFYATNHTLDVDRPIDRRTLDGVVELISAGVHQRQHGSTA